MSRILVFLWGFFLLQSILVARTPWDGPPSTWKWVEDERIVTVTHHTLRSPSMGFDVGFNVYLPPSYGEESNRRYPVVYYLHGAGGSEKSANEFSWEVRRAISEGEIGEAIWVFPNGGTFSRYRDWKTENVKAETFLIRELIPHVDKTFRTIAGREARALAGYSMGGDGAVRFLFQYPEMFGAAGAMAAAIDWTHPETDGGVLSFDLAKRNADQLRGRCRLFLCVGEEDRLLGVNRRFHRLLQSLNLESELVTHPGIAHNLGLLKKESARDLLSTIDSWFQGEQGSGEE